MAVSPYFNHFTNTSEQSLLNDLVQESIQLRGIDLKYLPRTLVNIDKIFGEEGISQFNSATEIEMYIDSVDGFGGEGDFYSKFGLQIRDQLILTVSRKRWSELAITDRNRPYEGDLIYFPLNDKLFEIKFVEHEKMFYSLGELPVYQLTCELFEYSSEKFDTGNTSIDDIETSIFADTIYDIKVENFNSIDFIPGELVIQKDSDGNVKSRAIVHSWNGSNYLRVKHPVGMMTVGEVMYGQDSNAEADYTDEVGLKSGAVGSGTFTGSFSNGRFYFNSGQSVSGLQSGDIVSISGGRTAVGVVDVVYTSGNQGWSYSEIISGSIPTGDIGSITAEYLVDPDWTSLTVESEKLIDLGSDNTDLETRGDNIFDFTETDPFSEGNY